MSTDRAPKKTLKDKRSKLEKILDKVSGMGITKSELTKAIRGMKSMNRGNPGVAGASTTKPKRMGPPAGRPTKEIPVVDPMRYGGMVKKKKEEEKVMAKLCARGKAAAKRKFDVYPSAYANMYASAVCSGKVTPGGKKKKKKMAGGGEVLDFNKISQDRKRISSYAQGGIAKGCGAIMQKKRKKTKKIIMAKKGLRAWVKEKWVDIGAPDGKGGYKPCGRSKGEKRKGYPKCVPLAKARSMSKGQKRSAVARKRAAGNTGPKPKNVATFAKKKEEESSVMNEDIIVDLIKQYGQERAIQIALNAGVPVTAIQYALSTPIGQAAQGDFYNMMGDVGGGIKKGAFNLSDMLLGTNFITPIGMGPRPPRVDQPNEQAMQMLTPQEQVQQTQQQIINEINQANQNNQNNQGGGGGSFVSGPAGMSGPSTPTGPNLVNRAQGGIVTLHGRY